jgi:hypothetical protein
LPNALIDDVVSRELPGVGDGQRKSVAGADVEITNRIGQRALTYVAAVTSQGYELTSEEFERYIGMPMPEVSSAWAKGPAAEPDGAEPVLDWLVRLGWLTRTSGTVGITPLGRAVLRAVEQHELATELPPEVVLGPAEPFTYGPVLGRIGDLHEPILVDRTFQFDQFLEVMLRTSVTRILVGADAQYEQDRRRLAAALSRPLGLDRHLRVGVSAELHDRFVVPPTGPVGFLAATRNVLGHRHSIFGFVQAPAADDIRRHVEDLWSRATPLTAEQPLTVGAPAGDVGAEPAEAEPDTVPHAHAPAPAAPAPVEPLPPMQPPLVPESAQVQLPSAAPPPDPVPGLPPFGGDADRDLPAAGHQAEPTPGPDPWNVPRPSAPAAPLSPVTALRSLVSPLEGAALSGAQRPGGADDDPTRPAPPPQSPQPPLLRPVAGSSRPLNEPILRPVGEAQPPPRFDLPPPRFGEPPQAARFGEPPQAPRFGDRQSDAPEPATGEGDGGEARPLPPPPWSPPNPWTPPNRVQSPFQRNDRHEGNDEEQPTQAWSADDRDR